MFFPIYGIINKNKLGVDYKKNLKNILLYELKAKTCDPFTSDTFSQ